RDNFIYLPKPGDMIQFQMFGFQHWGIYVGEEEVAINATSLFPAVEGTKFKVRKEKIKDVQGVLKIAVWNKFDEKYPPLDPVCVVKRARHMENKVLRYNLAKANCEHFATLMRYDKALSDQVRPTNRSFIRVAGPLGVFGFQSGLFIASEGIHDSNSVASDFG
uniref:LRAT domain-containing protein n=1 Tax=Pseudonaja textilis TaxID=8673 RepID=A0A670XYE8_PSETE